MSDRTLGHYSTSIATSLAIEGATLTGEFEDKTKKPGIINYDELWLNIRTLVRNAFEAYSNDDRDYITSEKLGEDVIEDIEQIKQHLNVSYPTVVVHCYICEYHNLNKQFPNALFREPTTRKQIDVSTIIIGAIKYLLEKIPTYFSEEFLISVNWQLTSNKRCLLLTNYPLDLLSVTKFNELGLLESHTGSIKKRDLWWTKMSLNKDGSVIPFHLPLLQIYGDSALFKPQPIKIRKYLAGLSERKGWHPLTTIDKVRSDIRLDNEPYALEFINRYMN